MKRSYLFVGLFLFSSFLFAQTPAARIQMSEEIKGQRTNQVNLDINLLQSLALGFAIELPAETIASITKVMIDTESIWLKNEATVPQRANTLHWTEQSGQIVLLFAPGTLIAGQAIQLSLQVFQQTDRSESRELRLNQIEALDRNTCFQLSIFH